MSSSTSPQFNKEMQTLQQNYLKRLASNLAELRRFHELFAVGRVTQADIQQFYRLSHNFAGSGTTFGFPEISRTARAFHSALGTYAEAPVAGEANPQHAAVLETLNHFIETSKEYITRKPGGAVDETPSVPVAKTIAGMHVALFTHDKATAEAFLPALEQAGYSAAITQDASLIISSLNGDGPFCAVVVITDFTKQSQLDLARCCRVDRAASIPLIAVAPNEKFDTRLAAVRLGAQAFFSTECDTVSVAECITRLRKQVGVHYRVLIVDDDEMIVEFYSHALKAAGMQVVTANTPKQALKLLTERFDLALIDFSIPHCSGRELAAMLRQDERHANLPVIFMSARDNIDSLKANDGLVGDDFLTKPFTPEQLIGLVKARARRRD